MTRCLWTLAMGLVSLLAFAACRKPLPPQRDAVPRHVEAQLLFEKATKEFHLPSAEASGAKKEKLLAQAAAAYEQITNDYPDQPAWAAPAMRSLGGVRVEQGRLTEGIQLLDQVGRKFPDQSWEILQAWKTAGDVLWEANRRAEAGKFYEKIVARFDTADAPAIYKTVVRGARGKLADAK